MSEEASPLKKKFEELEEEVRKLREPLESTLMDVRELVSNLENPFNYATSILGTDGLRKGSANSAEVERAEEPALEEPVRDLEEHVTDESFQPHPGRRREGRRNLSVLLCAYLLLKVLGREKALNFLNSRSARKFAPIDLLELLNDSIELLSSYEVVDGFPPGGQPAFREDMMLMAIYLVHALAMGADESFFMSLTLAIKILDHDSKSLRR